MKTFLILILTVLFSSYLQANTPNINECISDVYYANSIMTSKKQATRYRDLIADNTLMDYYAGSYTKMNKELNFKTSYNRTHGTYGDIYDTYMFLASEEDGWKTYIEVIGFVVEESVGKGVSLAAKLARLSKRGQELVDKILDTINVKDYLDIYSIDRSTDLSKQIADYRNSIRLGHGIILVAHGKGDIFTAKAYEDMLKPEGSRDNAWMEEYISWMSIGSPTKDARGFHPYINFDNDTLAYWSTLNTTTNPNRSYITNALGEAVEQNSDMQFHLFNYYMGEAISFEDGYGRRNISTDIGKKVIMGFLATSIQKHRDASSQWALEDLVYNSKYSGGHNRTYFLAKFKHLFDTSIVMNEDVYPFSGRGKLYKVLDNTGGSGWVKASIGGKEVTDSWIGQKENQVYNIDNNLSETVDFSRPITNCITISQAFGPDKQFCSTTY